METQGQFDTIIVELSEAKLVALESVFNNEEAYIVFCRLDLKICASFLNRGMQFVDVR